MDWLKTGYSYNVEVNVVHQTNIDNTLGSLSGVQLENLTITENYYSDSRVQAKVTTMVADGLSDGYIENARLRIILEIPEREWSKELVTGYVSDIDETYEFGYVKRQYSIEGTIWGLLNHKMKSSVTIAKGASMISCWVKLMRGETKMQYSTEGAKDKTFTNNIVYEPGTDLSTLLFELSSGYSRMDTDGHGRVTLKEYIAPAKKIPEVTIDFNDLQNLSFTPLERTSSAWEAPGRAIVTANISVENKNGKTEQKVIAGYYDAPATDRTSINVRGYLIARSDSYSGSIEKPDVADLNPIAKKNWKDNQDLGIEWRASSVFADYHPGTVATLYAPINWKAKDLKAHKVLISQVETNLQSMTQSLTMKEL